MFPFKTKFRLIKGPFKTGFTVFSKMSVIKCTLTLLKLYRKKKH